MLKKDKFIQIDLFGVSTIPIEPKKIKIKLSPEEKLKVKEKSEAHQAWKLLKSNRFNEFLSERQKFLLQKYYGIKL